MPRGSFVVLLPSDSDYKILGYYFKDKLLDFEITSDLFLRLNLDHSKNEYNLLKLKDLSIFSYFYRFKGKLSRKANGIILGLIMDESDKPEKFRSSLKNTAILIENLDPLTIEKGEFERQLKEIYQEELEPLIDIMQPDVLKENIINTTKQMLSGGKKDRNKAQELLEKIEDGVHEKIIEFYKNAEKALKSKDFDKAGKFFNKSAEIADELFEKELSLSLKEKASFAKKIPDLSRTRDKVVQEARTALRNEDFHRAYLNYKKASELSKELIEFEKEEEYKLKSKALQDFYQVDQEYKKK